MFVNFKLSIYLKVLDFASVFLTYYIHILLESKACCATKGIFSEQRKITVKTTTIQLLKFRLGHLKILRRKMEFQTFCLRLNKFT